VTSLTNCEAGSRSNSGVFSNNGLILIKCIISLIIYRVYNQISFTLYSSQGAGLSGGWLRSMYNRHHALYGWEVTT